MIGPGGIGKTRLALEIAHQMAPSFANGAYFVPLQALNDVNHIVVAIINALPLQLVDSDNPRQRLLNYLREKQLLLLLDNFEHLLEGVEILHDILDVAKNVKLLVTSRERLNLNAEQIWSLEGLKVIDDEFDHHAPPSAVQLFVERAQRVQPAFNVENNLISILKICHTVDGIPLALELAASWVHVLPCDAIALRIQENIDSLVSRQRDIPARHQSMRGVFDSSWRLLTETEQVIFQQLSVFQDGFTAEAAEQAANAELPILASLIDKSLLRMDEHGRYELHELLRQYAHEQLEASGTEENVLQSYCTYYADFVSSRHEDLKGRRQKDATDEIQADFENVRRAWIWAADHMREDILNQMIDSLLIYARNRSRHQDVRVLYRHAKAKLAPVAGQSPDTRRVWGRLVARSMVRQGDVSQLNTALEIAKEVEDQAETAFCLKEIGIAAYDSNDFETATALFEQSLAIYRHLGDAFDIAQALYQRTVADHTSEWESLWRNSKEVLRLTRATGDRVGMGRLLALEVIHEMRVGNFAEAEQLWLERIALGQELENPTLVTLSQAHLAYGVYFFQGEFERAQATAESSIRLADKIGNEDAACWAIATLGLIASMDGHYEKGQRFCQHAIKESYFADISKLATWGLAIVLCGLGDHKMALARLDMALLYLTNILGVVGALASLPIVANFYAHENQRVKAVELLALAFTHPVSASSWMEKWPLLDRLCAELKQTLGSDNYSDAWERGTRLNLDTVMEILQKELFGLDNPIAHYSQDLPVDTLSERELEVLRLITSGLTNREIADQLFVGVSTVKKHIQHIYEKLHAKNRTSAVVRARELNIIP